MVRRLLALLLIALGVAAAGYAVHVRGKSQRYSDVRTVQLGGLHRGNGSEVITRRVGSDSLVIGLFGVAALLVLGGAFYDRIQRISVGSNAVELYPLATSAEERSALSAAVASAVEERLSRNPVPNDPRDWVDIAVRTASAAAIAQQQAEAYLSIAAAASIPHRPDLERARLARRGMPMSNELLEQLAQQAVEVTFAPAESEQSDGGGDGV